MSFPLRFLVVSALRLQRGFQIAHPVEFSCRYDRFETAKMIQRRGGVAAEQQDVGGRARLEAAKPRDAEPLTATGGCHKLDGQNGRPPVTTD